MARKKLSATLSGAAALPSLGIGAKYPATPDSIAQVVGKADEHDTDLDRVDAIVLPPCPNAFDPTTTDYATLATGITPVVGSRLVTLDGTKAWDKYGATALQWNPVSTSSSGTDQTARDAAAAAAATANAAIPSAQKGAASGVATLDSNQKLTASQIPAIALVEYLGSVASQVAMLALTGQKGDWCVRSDLGANWIITGTDPTQIGSWTELTYPASPVSSVAGRTGAVTLTTADVPDSTDHRYCTDAEKTVIDNTSGVNSGDEPPTATRTISGTTDTLRLADANGVVASSNSSPTTVTIPLHSSVAFLAEAIVNLFAGGTGTLVVAKGSTTLMSAGVSVTSVTIPAGQGAMLVQTDTLDTWNLVTARGAVGNTIHETGGPTDLTAGAVPDGTIFVRSGGTYVGTTLAALMATRLAHYAAGTGSVAIDFANGVNQKIQLASGANAITSLANGTDGVLYKLLLVQPSSGAAGTITVAGSGGDTVGTIAGSLSPTNSKRNILTLEKDGTYWMACISPEL